MGGVLFEQSNPYLKIMIHDPSPVCNTWTCDRQKSVS